MFASQRSSKTPSTWQKLTPKCANSSCTTKGLFQAFANRNNGMSVNGKWYCGSKCLEQALKGTITEMVTFTGKPVKARTARLPLGLTLLQRGVLSAEQLKAALEQHKSSGANFGEVVQQLGFATAEQVTAAVAAQWACPVFPVGDRRLELGIRIPRRFLELCEMLPVHYAENERRLLIGFVSGVHHQVLYTIGQMTSCTVAPCFISAGEYSLHLNSPTTPFLRDDELVFEQVMDVNEMARITTNYVAQLSAEKMRVGKCHDYLWTRIWGRKREMDLLFQMQSS
jgi:hypothetical protein